MPALLRAAAWVVCVEIMHNRLKAPAKSIRLQFFIVHEILRVDVTIDQAYIAILADCGVLLFFDVNVGNVKMGKVVVQVVCFLALFLNGCFFPQDAPERLPVYDTLESAKGATGRLELDLSGKGLTAIPEGLDQIAGLERLRLRGNNLGDVGAEIASLGHVPWIDMGRTQIKSLSDEVLHLHVLHSWWLSDNALERFPDGMLDLGALRYLNLDRNRLTQLPEGIGQMQSLRWLRLNGNNLTTLPDSITELASLERLYLAYNQISVLPADIGHMQGLDTLVLTGNPLQEGELARVREALPDCNVVFRVRQ